MADIKVPELAESITEGTIAKWLKNPGDSVQKGDYLVELETDKVNIEIISDYSGIITEQKFAEGDTVKVGETIAVVNEGGESAAEITNEPLNKLQQQVESVDSKTPITQSEEKSAENIQRSIASPAARKLARERGLNLNEVPTMDPLGRVRKQDVTS